MPGTGGAWGRIRKHLTGRAMSDGEAKKIGLVAILTARAGSAAALKDALAAIIPGVRTEPGCLRYDMNVDVEDEHRVVMLEEWSSEAALEAHAQAPAFRSLAARFNELLEVVPVLMRLRLVTMP
ncbi:putative quinol monooxygenase [Xanthobacter sp. V0B-10]|uniref:putative quinol monooxygenase n=1 Tax=Xanthobacter albus TaxID=3119929 RepID=UPI003728DAF4